MTRKFLSALFIHHNFVISINKFELLPLYIIFYNICYLPISINKFELVKINRD